MFDGLAYAPLGIWIIALLIVLADSVVLLKPGEHTYKNSNVGYQVRIRFTANPFLFHEREPVVTLIVYPGIPFGICKSNRSSESVRILKRILIARRRTQNKFIRLTIYSWGALSMVLAIGPIISLQYGVERSILVVWPIAYVLSACVLVTLWFEKHSLGLSSKGVIGIGLELIFCPFLTFNVWKKIAIHQHEFLSTESLMQFADQQTLSTLKRVTSLKDTE